MTETKIGTAEVRGQEFEIRVTGTGTFLTRLDGQTVDSSTYDGLIAKLQVATRKAAVRIALRVCAISEQGRLTNYPEIVRGTITGIHGANGNLLVTWDGGKSEQLTKYTDMLPDLDEEQETRLNRMLHEAWSAQRALAQYKARLPRFNAYRKAEQLVKEAEAGE